jgi:hypothetical protein
MAGFKSLTSRHGGLGLPLLAGLFVYATTLAAARRVISDPDPYLHIAVGRWIIAHGAVPHHDPFSNSMPNAPWVPHEWLAEVATAWLYDHWGWAGLVVATAICFAATITILVHFLLRYLTPSHVLIAAIGTWGLCYVHLLARPHIFVWPLLALWVAGLVAARSKERAPPLLMALIIVVWANLHGSFVLGLGLAAIFALEALLEAQDKPTLWRAARNWMLFLAVSFAAGLATPNGIAGLIFPFQFARMNAILSMVQEWRSPDFQDAQPLEFYLMLLLVGVLLIGIKLPVMRIVLLVLLLHMALGHRRNVEYLGLILPMIAAPALSSQLQAYSFPRFDKMLAGLTALTDRTAAMLAAVLALAVGVGFVRFSTVSDPAPYSPQKAVAFAQDHRLTGPVFNDYVFGDYLIFAGVAPFVDGRADMYGNDFIARFRSPENIPTLLVQYKISWMLLEPGGPKAALMNFLPGWRRAYADDVAVIYVRSDDAAGR